MTNYEKIYWLTRLDNIGSFFNSLTGVLIALVVAHYLVKLALNVIDTDHSWYPTKGILKTKVARVITFVLIGISFLVITLLPTRNEMLVIMAGGKTMDYIQKDSSLSKIPYQTTEIISTYLQKELKEMKDEVKKEVEKK